MRHICYGALTLLLLLTGCKSKESKQSTQPTASASAQAKSNALEVKWVGKRFSLEGERARGNFVVPSQPEGSKGMTVRSYLYDFPTGTKATFGKETASVKDKKPLVQDADFTDKVANLELDQVQRKRVELDIPLTIAYPDRGELKLKTPPLRVAHAVAHQLTLAEKEPAKFPGEKADSGKPDTVAIVRVRSRSRRMRILGDGKLISDIDWVAIERTHGEPRNAECPRPGKKPRKLKLTDLEVAVFERLTAKPVETKVFAAKPQCTPVKRGAQGPKTQRQLIDEWLREKLGLPPEPEKPSKATVSAAAADKLGKPVRAPKQAPQRSALGVSPPGKPAAPAPPKPAASPTP
jgi:hypothetical protein